MKAETTMCSKFPNSEKDIAEQIPGSENEGLRELQPDILVGKTVISVRSTEIEKCFFF